MDLEICLPTLQAAADYHAARVARRLNLSRDDCDDLRQDLLTEMIDRLRRFDAEKAAVSTFIDLLARHAAYALVRRHRALRRLRAHTISLDDEINPMARRLAELLTSEQGLEFAAGEPVDAVDRVELTRDVRHIVAALAPELRSICTLLQAYPAEQACRASGLSRATFYRRLRDIRLRFLLAGLAAAA
jgi:RNA polymerase sigma-70 factor (ECF subfamily)